MYGNNIIRLIEVVDVKVVVRCKKIFVICKNCWWFFFIKYFVKFGKKVEFKVKVIINFNWISGCFLL